MLRDILEIVGFFAGVAAVIWFVRCVISKLD